MLEFLQKAPKLTKKVIEISKGHLNDKKCKSQRKKVIFFNKKEKFRNS